MPWVLAIGSGALLGALGARRNRARHGDERVLWVLGGALGAAAAFALGVGLAAAMGRPAGPAALLLWAAWATGSLLASVLAPRLDSSGRRGAWLVSLAIKLAQCPVASLLGLLAATIVGRGRPQVELRDGTLFARAGAGPCALTLGGVVLVQHGLVGPDGRVTPPIARHESYHARNAACLGEWGFYLTYVTLGAWRASAAGAPWNGLAANGRGNPFERTAYEREPESSGPDREPALAMGRDAIRDATHRY